jgi:hypothetical protein
MKQIKSPRGGYWLGLWAGVTMSVIHEVGRDLGYSAWVYIAVGSALVIGATYLARPAATEATLRRIHAKVLFMKVDANTLDRDHRHDAAGVLHRSADLLLEEL